MVSFLLVRLSDSPCNKRIWALKHLENGLQDHYIASEEVLTYIHALLYCKVKGDFSGQPLLLVETRLVHCKNQQKLGINTVYRTPIISDSYLSTSKQKRLGDDVADVVVRKWIE